jgi:hypothetical protein
LPMEAWSSCQDGSFQSAAGTGVGAWPSTLSATGVSESVHT